MTAGPIRRRFPWRLVVQIIENATVYDDVGAAAHDLTFLAALSARRRDMPVRMADPRGVTAEILPHGSRAGLMFGPEKSGSITRKWCVPTGWSQPT